MDVVIKTASAAVLIQLAEIPLSRVAEGRMPQVVPQGDGLDQLQIQPQDGADIPGDPGDQLYVQRPAGDVVVVIKREHLGLVRIAVIYGQMQNLFRIPHKNGPPEVCPVFGHIRPAHRRVVIKAEGIDPSVFSVPRDPFLQPV